MCLFDDIGENKILAKNFRIYSKSPLDLCSENAFYSIRFARSISEIEPLLNEGCGAKPLTNICLD